MASFSVACVSFLIVLEIFKLYLLLFHKDINCICFECHLDILFADHFFLSLLDPALSFCFPMGFSVPLAR